MEPDRAGDASPADWPDPDGSALLFDFDGTLAAIAETPDSVVLAPQVRHALGELQERFDGAVAVVSGRPVDQLAALLRIDGLPLAGVHGLEIRDADGSLRRESVDPFALDALVAGARAFAAGHPDLLVEAKPGSVAIHYRRKPELAGPVLDFSRRLAAAVPGVERLRGKMVTELRLGGRNKGDAVRALSDLPAFAGRRPWFFGDDVTDEDGFVAADALGGSSFKIGPGPTRAGNRFEDIDAFHRWLLVLAGAAARKRRGRRTRPEEATSGTGRQ